MARALKSDLIKSPRWAVFVRMAHDRGDASHPEKCPNCGASYTVYIVVLEDGEKAVKLLRKQLLNDCPQHSESYEIDANENRITSNLPTTKP